MPREMKDGLMACPKNHIQSYPSTLKELRVGCLELLAEHEANTPDTLWQETDGPGKTPSTETEKSLLRLATAVSTGKGRPVFPPENTRLSDELVYLATKYLGAKERGTLYPYDFLPRGDINPERVPSGVAPIVWAHGLPFFPVFKGYYILCGRTHATWIGWHLRARNHRYMLPWPVWTIGPVVAPGSALKEPRSIERQARVWKMSSAKDAEWGREKNCVARDVVSFAHMDGSVVPKDSKGGFFVTQLFRVHGYSVRVGPDLSDLRKGNVQPKGFFSKNRVQDFDYEACLKRPYRNWRNPMIYGDHEGEGADVDSDGDTEMNEPEKSATDVDQENDKTSDEKTEADSVESGEIIEHVNGDVINTEIVQSGGDRDGDAPTTVAPTTGVEKDQVSPVQESTVTQNEVQRDIQKKIGNEDVEASLCSRV